MKLVHKVFARARWLAGSARLMCETNTETETIICVHVCVCVCVVGGGEREREREREREVRGTKDHTTSDGKTSKAPPARWPERSAAAAAATSTTLPRLALIKYEPACIWKLRVNK